VRLLRGMRYNSGIAARERDTEGTVKSIILAIALLFVADTSQTLTQEERDRAVAELEGSKKAFLDATKGLSAAQWNFKPAPERWSVAECSEHIALSEGYIFGLVSEKIMKAPANPEKREAAKGKDELILKMMQDRSHKATAPEPLDPAKHGPMPGADSVKLFLDNRAHTIEYVKTTQDDLRDHLFDHPVPAIGTLDGYQWIMLISGHTRRHTAQILEVKADPNFPKM
jgi:DinB superfamily